MSSIATLSTTLRRALTEAPPADRFFNALTEADSQIAENDHLGFLAAFAPPAIYHEQCWCGSVMEIRPSDGREELTADDHDAIRQWDDTHSYCEVDAEAVSG